MKMNLTRKELGHYLQKYLELDDFKVITKHAGGIIFTRGSEHISMDYGVYLKYKLNEGIRCDKDYPEVSQLLSKYMSIHDYQGIIYYSARPLEGIGRNDELDVDSAEEIKNIIEPYKRVVYEEILPFFDKYQTLDAVNEEIDRRDVSNIARFISGDLVPKIMTIKRLVNADNFNAYTKNALAINEKMARGEAIGKPTLFLPDLYEELKNLDLQQTTASAPNDKTAQTSQSEEINELILGDNIAGLVINHHYQQDIAKLAADIDWDIKIIQEISAGEAAESWTPEGECRVCFTDKATLIFFPHDWVTHHYRAKSADTLNFAAAEIANAFQLEYYQQGKLKRSLFDNNGEREDQSGEPLSIETEIESAEEIITHLMQELLGQKPHTIDAETKAYRCKNLSHQD